MEELFSPRLRQRRMSRRSFKRYFTAFLPHRDWMWKVEQRTSRDNEPDLRADGSSSDGWREGAVNIWRFGAPAPPPWFVNKVERCYWTWQRARVEEEMTHIDSGGICTWSHVASINSHSGRWDRRGQRSGGGRRHGGGDSEERTIPTNHYSIIITVKKKVRSSFILSVWLSLTTRFYQRGRHFHFYVLQL